MCAAVKHQPTDTAQYSLYVPLNTNQPALEKKKNSKKLPLLLTVSSLPDRNFLNWKFRCISVGNVHPLVKFLGQSAWTFSITRFGIRHELGLMLGCRLHDRKMCVLGLCTLLSMTGNRLQVLTDEAHRILPSLILIFKGLKRAYECKNLRTLFLQPGVVNFECVRPVWMKEDPLRFLAGCHKRRLNRALSVSRHIQWVVAAVLTFSCRYRQGCQSEF